MEGIVTRPDSLPRRQIPRSRTKAETPSTVVIVRVALNSYSLKRAPVARVVDGQLCIHPLAFRWRGEPGIDHLLVMHCHRVVLLRPCRKNIFGGEGDVVAS